MRTIITTFFSLFNLIILFSQEQVYFKPSQIVYENENISLAIEESYKEIITTIPNDFSRQEKDKLKKKYFQRKLYSEELLKSGLIITSGPLFDFLDSLKIMIIKSNPEIRSDLQIYPVRNLNFNAFTTGDNIVYVNLGLLYRSKNIEQIIFVLCHEIGHNVLEHNRISHELTIRNIQNDSILSLLRSRAHQRYGAVSEMNELIFPLLSMNRENSRKHEFQADSLGIKYYNNLNLPFSEVKASFQLMKELDHLRDTTWLGNNLQQQFHQCGHDLNDLRKYYKPSSLNITESDKDTLSVLRTHPFEDDRISFLEKIYTDNLISIENSNENLFWRYFTENEMIHNAFIQKGLVEAIFLILQSDSNFIDNAYAKELIAVSFAILAFEKKQRHQGDYIGYISVDNDQIYKEFQSYIRDMSPEDCFKLAMCLKPENSVSSHYSNLFQAYEFAYKKENEKFQLILSKFDLTDGYWYYDPLIRYCSFNKLKCKTK